MTTSSRQFDLRNPIHFCAVGFGSGLLKPAPGTWGSVVGAVLVLISHALVGSQTIAYLALTLFIAVIGIYICGKTARDIGVHDHGSIVWDEIAGMFVVMAFVPFSYSNLFYGFILFRVFDIFKPWPIRWLDQHVDDGVGIMIDDLIAGCFAGLLLYLLINYLG